jgi:MFS family permease
MSQANENAGLDAPAANAYRLLWGGFMAILAAGVGFSIRGGFLDNWRAEFGFTDTEIGMISGAGFTGFCFGIIIGGVICDKIGYGKLVIAAFALHLLSALVTFAPNPSMDKQTVSLLLTWGSFIFAFANGTLEAVANPLVATLFSHNRTHYLNILHASWPAGLVLGSASGWVLDDLLAVHWKLQFALFLVPTVLYGIMFFAQHFPKSEASQKGIKLGEMFQDVGVLGAFVVCYLLALFFNGFIGVDMATSYTIAGMLLVGVGFLTRTETNTSTESMVGVAVCALVAMFFQQGFNLPTNSTLVIGGALLFGLGKVMKWSLGSFMLFTLFIAHSLVGAVELGTDNWIQNITGNILTSQEGKWLFVFTSMTMFALRFCADFIEKRLGLSPVGILLTCAILACVGLNLTSMINSFGLAMLALTVYAVGKTFFWPTMLAVASDRFPRTGAVAISIMGGVGMMSAGLIGAPGLGYAKDRFAGEALRETNPASFEQFRADKPSKFLPLVFAESTGLDGKKLGELQQKLDDARTILGKGKVAELQEAKLSKLSENARKAAREKHQSLKALEAKLNEAGVLKEGGNSDPEAAFLVLSPAEKDVHAASIRGDRKTLVADSVIPAAMAVIYLLLLGYFKSIGGYKPVHIDAAGEAAYEAAR